MAVALGPPRRCSSERPEHEDGSRIGSCTCLLIAIAPACLALQLWALYFVQPVHQRDAAAPPTAQPENFTENFCARIQLSNPQPWGLWTRGRSYSWNMTGRDDMRQSSIRAAEAAAEFVDQYESSSDCVANTRCTPAGMVRHSPTCRDCSPVYQSVGGTYPTFLAYDAERCVWSVKQLRGVVTSDTFLGSEV